MRHAELRVFPFADGDGVIKGPPHFPVGQLLRPGGAQPEVLHRQDGPLPGLVEQGLAVGAVVEDKAFLGVAAAEVGAQQGEHPVFGFNLPGQHPVQLGKADKAGVQVGLAVQMLDRFPHLVHSGVGQVPGEAGALGIAQPEQPPQPQLLVGQAGEKAPGDQLLTLAAQLAPQGAVHPARPVPVTLHRPQGIQGAAGVVRGAELHRLLAVDITFEYAGEKAREAAVVLAAHLGPGHGTTPLPC